MTDTVVFEAYSGLNATTRVHHVPRVRSIARDVAVSPVATSAVFELHRAPRVRMTASTTDHASMLLRHPAPRVRMADASNVFLLHRAPQVALSGGVPIPSASVFALNGPGPRVRMTATVEDHATMRFHRQPRVLLGGAGARFMLRRQPQVFIYDGVPRTARTAFLLQQPVLTSSVVPGFLLQRAEQLGFADNADAQQVMVRNAMLALGLGNATTLLDALDKIHETLTFDAVSAVVWQLLHTEALALEGTVAISHGMLLQMADALALAAGHGSQMDALQAVVAALRLGEAAGYTWPVSVLETLGLMDTPVATLLALNRRTAMLGLGDSAVGFASFAMLAPDTLALGDAAGTTAELLHQITEGMQLLVRFSLPDGEYLAWVCNTDSRAFTSYRNFPFNSFCEIGGRYYGATDTGIYLLEGDDDAGTPIAARLRTGLGDMGTGRLKRAAAMYLGYRAGGDMVLKVVTTSDGGEKHESWYALAARPGTDMQANRVKVGKGLKSLYWGFELANVDGADFALDKISFLPMVLERKI
jgi:hypothetical protein